jgi:hypothetical protein
VSVVAGFSPFWLDAHNSLIATRAISLALCRQSRENDLTVFYKGSTIMSRATLEERIATLEKKVDALMIKRGRAGATKDWRRTSGAFTGDEVMKQIFAEGRKIREAERKRAKSRKRKSQSARS